MRTAPEGLSRRAAARAAACAARGAARVCDVPRRARVRGPAWVCRPAPPARPLACRDRPRPVTCCAGSRRHRRRLGGPRPPLARCSACGAVRRRAPARWRSTQEGRARTSQGTSAGGPFSDTTLSPASPSSRSLRASAGGIRPARTCADARVRARAFPPCVAAHARALSRTCRSTRNLLGARDWCGRRVPVICSCIRMLVTLTPLCAPARASGCASARASGCASAPLQQAQTPLACAERCGTEYECAPWPRFLRR